MPKFPDDPAEFCGEEQRVGPPPPTDYLDPFEEAIRLAVAAVYIISVYLLVFWLAMK